jgi:hypothetical protein
MREARTTLGGDLVRFGAIAVAIAACGEEFTSGSAASDASSAGGSSGSSGGSKASGGSADAASRGAGGTGTSGGTGGKGGSAGTASGGSSGVSSGGSTGGAMTGGSSGTGKGGSSGVSSGGSSGTGKGGSSGSGGVSGTGSGGVSTAGTGGVAPCTPGALECDAQPPQRCGQDARWQPTTCGPLKAADVTNLDSSGLPGFNIGHRCKTVTLCTLAQNCIYYGENLGVLQSSEATFYDGLELTSPEQVRVRIDLGAASQCMDPVITLSAGEKLLVAHDGQTHTIYFPAVSTRQLTLFVREDGATFFDAALMSPAQLPP